MSKLCRFCGQPMRPRNAKSLLPGEYEHAEGCRYSKRRMAEAVVIHVVTTPRLQEISSRVTIFDDEVHPGYGAMLERRDIAPCSAYEAKLMADQLLQIRLHP